MRWIYLSATLAFWIVVGAIWVAGSAPDDGRAPGAVVQRTVTATELARHGRPGDCWMAIRGNVYDLTAFLPEHPSRPGIVEPWCGKEATAAYDTKMTGHPHSSEADTLLERYRIGAFAGTLPPTEVLQPHG